MKHTYESFEELANAMTDGCGTLHAFNCPGNESPDAADCIPWQMGVKDFAGWLDHIGVKVNITDSAKNFYDYMQDKNASSK